MKRMSSVIGSLFFLSVLCWSCSNAQEPDSKLKIVDDKVGTGDEAKKGDIVEVHYTGKLKDGTKFDSSRDRKDPFVFQLGAGMVIKGWDQGVAGMKVGGTRQLTIPAELAYGKEGRPPVIPPNSELTFDIELLRVIAVKVVDDKVGTGAEAKKGDTVEVHYTGKLKDGTKFDSSRDRKDPFVFKLGAGMVIKGWDQGVVGMKVGGLRKLIIPSDLAYGKEGRPPVIPPDSELTFDIELLKIQ